MAIDLTFNADQGSRSSENLSAAANAMHGPTPPPINPNLALPGSGEKIKPAAAPINQNNPAGAAIEAAVRDRDIREQKQTVKLTAYQRVQEKKSQALLEEARAMGRFVDTPDIQDRNDIRRVRSGNAIKVFKFIENHLDQAMSMLIVLMGDPFANAVQLKAVTEVIRISALDVAETITNAIDLSDCANVQEKLERVTDLYSAGAITEKEHGVLIKGLQAVAAQINNDALETIAKLNAAEDMRIAEERVKAGKGN